MTDAAGSVRFRGAPLDGSTDEPTVHAHSVVLATLVAGALVAVYLLAPPMGGDLAAQIAHADFARGHPWTPVDLRWFGGVLPFAYSLWTPLLMAVVGVRLTGALATVAAVALFTQVLRQAGARRPTLGGIAAAITFTSSLAEGRVTFACGLACGLAAIVLLGHAGRPHRGWAAVAAVVAGAASPVVTVFLLVGVAALTLRSRFLDALALAASSIPVIAVAWLFPDNGRQVFGAHDAVRALLATVLVVVLVPRRFALLRVGAVLGVLMVGAAIVLPTPLGSNSARLSLLCAVPIVVACTELRAWLTPLAVAAVVLAQTPVTLGTLTGAGRPVTDAAYFVPLAQELIDAGRTGRVEVPELTGHWDAAYLARTVPLARGWLRQTDTELNDDVFYRHLPTAAAYRAFLDRNAVQFVAVADARPTFYGRREISLIDAGLPYLSPLWHGAHWTLYRVSTPTPIVAGPGTLTAYREDRVVLQAPADVDVTIRVRWSRWLTVTAPGPGACLRPAGTAIVLHTGPAGTYEITSSLTRRQPPC